MTTSLQSTDLVLYGATGDLARRMVLPALYGLAAKHLLPERWRLIGNGRGTTSDEQFRDDVRQALMEAGVAIDERVWADFAECVFFAGGGFRTDDAGELPVVLGDRNEHTQIVHYLAVPPASFEDMTRAIGAHGLDIGTKVVFEKPYGVSPAEFEALEKLVHHVFEETQVFRLDHFLGKEGTQNIHLMRFGNSIVNAVWHRDHVQSVIIDIPEILDVGDRAEFYDRTGALLDMVVTHLFQLVAEVAMEPPLSLDADDVLTARETVIDAFRPVTPEDVVLGQFDGYRQTNGVHPQSTTDTFAALRLWVDTDRWHGVPFVLRTGKCLAQKAEIVSLVMRPSDGLTRHLTDGTSMLSFDLAGAGQIELALQVKNPGSERDMAAVPARLVPNEELGIEALAPYERLMLDVMRGDKTRFTRPDGLRSAWKALGPVLDNRPPVEPYAPGSWGPERANSLLGRSMWPSVGS